MNKPPKIVIAPISSGYYLTEGKEYNVITFRDHGDEHGYLFTIIDNAGGRMLCFEKRCGHIDDLDWIVKERES